LRSAVVVPTPPGKFLKVLFSPFLKGLESNGNLMSGSWKDLEFAVFQI